MNPSEGARQVERFGLARTALFADGSVTGAAFCDAYTDLVDAFVTALHGGIMASRPDGSSGIAVVALGGYGRRAMCPAGDVDLAVIHRSVDGVGAIAEAMWYPLWDAGLELGHAVRSLGSLPDGCAEVTTATALLDGRLVCGDPSVFDEMVRSVAASWQARRRDALLWLRTDAEDRGRRFGELADAHEPNLKHARGGLRDAQVPRWIEALGVPLDVDDVRRLDAAQTRLLELRVALHRMSRGAVDVVHRETRHDLARAAGCGSAGEFMAEVTRIGRTVRWVADELDERLTAESPRGGRHTRRTGVRRRGSGPSVGVIGQDVGSLLDVAVDTAARGGRLDRDLIRSAGSPDEVEVIWTPQLRERFVALLAAGRSAVPVIGSLVQLGWWERLVPGWDGPWRRSIRSAHEPFAPDRRVLETIVAIVDADPPVDGAEVLLLAACVSGFDDEEAAGWLDRLGLDPALRRRIDLLLTSHPMLVDTAARRDLGDPAVLDTVVEAVGSVENLEMAARFAIAVTNASGPPRWAQRKAGLVSTLVERVGRRLEGDVSEQYGRVFPTVEQMLLLRAGETAILGDGRVLTVVAPDRPGLFCRVAGVLVLRGLTVVSAEATSAEGMALEEFTVVPAFASGDLADAVEIDWDRVKGDLERAMAGKLAIEARVAERAVTYRKRTTTADPAVRLRFDDTVEGATVLEVDAPDGLGVLYRVTRAFVEVAVDIRQARIETLTDRVVDAFTIVDTTGAPIVDPEHRAEIERAVRHSLET